MTRSSSKKFGGFHSYVLPVMAATLMACPSTPNNGSDAGDASEPALAPGELQAGRFNRVGPVEVESGPDSLSRSIMMTATVAPLPAPLPAGFAMAGDNVEIGVSEPDAVVAPLLVRMRYDASLATPGRWLTVLHYDPVNGYRPAVVVSHDVAAHTLTFQSRTFSAFGVATGNAALPPTHMIPNFSPAANGWSIPNIGGAFTTGGNCLGMTTFAAWYFSRPNAVGQMPLSQRFAARPQVADILAMRAQLGALASWSNQPDAARNPPVTTAAQLETIKNNLVTFTTPMVLLLRGRGRSTSAGTLTPDAAHAILVYGYDTTALLAYDPNLPGRMVRVPYTAAGGLSGTVLDMAGAILFEQTTFRVFGLPDWGRPDDFVSLLAEADANFATSSDLTVQTPASAEMITNRAYDVTGAIGTALPAGSQAAVLAWGQVFPVRVAGDRTYRGAIPMFTGSSTLYVIASPGMLNTSAWQRNSAARAVPFQASLPRSELLALMTWDADESDMDMYLVAPDGRATWYGRDATEENVGALSIDNRDGYGPEYITVSTADGHVVQTGDYRLRAHLHSDTAGARGTARRIRVTAHLVIQPSGVPYTVYRRCVFFITEPNSSNAQPTDRGPDWREIATVNVMSGVVQSGTSPNGSANCPN